MNKFKPVSRERVLAIRKREQAALRRLNLKRAKSYRKDAELDIDQWGEPVDKEHCLRWAEEREERAKNEKYHFPAPYYVRAHEFYGRNYGWDPTTGYGHSYRWYTLAKVIRGQQVLNTYAYSQQTSGHVGKLRRLFDLLGVKYLEIDAPQGLQDLSRAMGYAIESLAEERVAEKYARIKNKRWARWSEKRWLKQIETLKSFGVKGYSNRAMNLALKQAEADRRARLDRAKEERKRKKALAAIKIVVDERDELFHEAGWHEFDQYFRPGSYREEYLRRDAWSRGHDKVIVHLCARPSPEVMAMLPGGAQ